MKRVYKIVKYQEKSGKFEVEDKWQPCANVYAAFSCRIFQLIW